jgi:hypothetical protein
VPRVTVLIALAFALLVATPAAAQPIDSPERLPLLRANVGTLPGMAGPVTSEGDMLEGFAYVVRVRGTYSAYARQLMLLQGAAASTWHFCGDRVGARGQDAEFIWGIPKPNGVFCPKLPIRHGNLLLDAGAGFEHLSPVDTLREPQRIRRRNRYEYLVIRENGDGPLSVGVADSSISDNIGSLRVRVRPLRRGDCVRGGWRDFGDAFLDRRDCLDFVP